MNFRKIILIVFSALVVSAGTYFYFDIYKEYGFKSKIGEILAAITGMDHWVRFSPEAEGFSILFPKSPSSKTHTISIPGSSNCLTYQEYSVEQKDEGLFSVSHMTLPGKWTKWGSSLTLKGAFKLIMQKVNHTKILGKKSVEFKGLPSLDYVHHSSLTETIGKLILVKNTLYRVEMTYPLHSQQIVKEQASLFIRSFEMQKQI